MSKLLHFDLGAGNLQEGFPRVSVEFWKNCRENPVPIKRCSSLPPIPHLVQVYERWQAIYQYAYKQSSVPENSTRMVIYPADVSHFSIPSFYDLCQELKNLINDWFKSDDFHRNIDQPIRKDLDSDDEFQVIIQTNDHDLVRRIPWHLWQFFETSQKPRWR